MSHDPTTPTMSHAGPSSLPASPQSPPSTTLRRPASHGRLSKLMTRSRSGSNASQASVTLPANDGPTSGRSTPELRRGDGRATVSLLATDAKYKKFAQLVDRSLQSFENVNEWADFISFLSRLLKTLQSPTPPYNEIPRKLVVAKRLAQCLNPALPSGVHQRALDVYAYIFSVIGVDGLKRDLLIWSSGLFPFFQYAATSVRPLLINIYERYYLPLGEELRPATKAFILALLPGMEEETGDFFDKILSLLDKLSAVSPHFFLSNILLILISTPSSRLSALNYLPRRLLKPPESADSGLLIRGVAAVLEDENVLVRRNGLDLLLRVLPLSELKDADARDQSLLVRATIAVVLQRELSLSRRVYSWLLGPGESSSEQLAYFKELGLELLVNTLQNDMISAVTGVSDFQRPFKIFLSLLDKWEIGTLLSERLAVPAIQIIKNGSADETLASAVYESVEPAVVWKRLHSSVLQELGTREKGHPVDSADAPAIELVRWILASIPQHDEEVISMHIPNLADALLGVLVGGARRCDTFDLFALRLVNDLLVHVPSGAWSKASAGPREGDQPDEVLSRIVTTAFDLCQSAIGTEETIETLRIVTLLIDQDPPALSSIEGASWLACVLKGLTAPSFAVVEALVLTALKASRCSTFSPRIDVTSDATISVILDSLFRYLRPNASPYHARAVELLWDYNQLAEIHTLENVIASRVASIPFDSAAFDAFGILWRLTDDAMLPGEVFNIPISLVLDAVKSTNPDIQRQAETWLRCNLCSYFRVIDPILARLLDPATRYTGGRYTDPIDVNLLQYLLENLSTLFSFGGQGLSKACQATELRHSSHPAFVSRAQDSFPNAMTYLETLVSLLSRFVNTEAPKGSATPLVTRLRATALDLLQTVVAHGDVSTAQLTAINVSLVAKLSAAIHQQQLTLQSKMLHLLHSSISQSRAHIPDEFELSLVKTIVDAVSSPSNLPILQHWIDFVLMTLAQLQTRPALLCALVECFSEQTRSFMLRIDKVYNDVSIHDEPCAIADAEVTMMLNALDRVLTLLAQSPKRRSEEGTRVEGGNGLLGLVSNVFTIEAPSAVRTESPRYMDDAVHALLLTWTLASRRAHAKIRMRSRSVLEKVFTTQPSALMTSCMHSWAGDKDAVVFDCIDALTPSAQKAVDLVCDIVSGKAAKVALVEYRADPTYLAFLEAYISRLEAPIAVQIWPTLFGFAKDVVGAVASGPGRVLLFPTLRCLTILALTVSRTSALEDRRLRRDLQDTYAKIVDLVVTNAARIAEDTAVDENALEKIIAFLATAIVPNLRTLLVDADRVNAVCSGIALCIVAPAFKRQRVDPSILRLVLEITKIPSAVKTWRVQIGETFNDARFFKPKTVEEVGYWKSLVCALADSDKERFTEVLGRVTSASSANIFSNREQEMLVKCLNLRRLSFMILAAERDHYLAQLPGIQERLVEMLRSNAVSPRVHSEVYLCLRVLLCRMSPRHLSNFWPVILSELLRIFEMTMDERPEDGSEQLQLILAVCKFLDLLLVIQSEDFQIHQWMFVTDTTDAAYPPEHYSPEAIMDRLAEIVSQSHGGGEKTIVSEILDEDNESGLRRPRLGHVHQLHSLHQLRDFFSRASIDTFEGVYYAAGADWDAIEAGLDGEIFE